MVTALKFFNGNAIFIYLILFVGMVIAVRRLLRAHNEMGLSMYGLERLAAQQHINQAGGAISIIIFLAFSEFVLTVFLAPNVPALSLLVTPTINPLITSTSTIGTDLLAYSSVPLEFTPTAQAIGCIPDQIMITSPKPGDVVQGEVGLVGTADIPNFGFFKYEFSPLGTGNWSTIQADREVKHDEELGSWNTSEVTPGDYDLRLVIMDNQGNALLPCIIPLRVVAPSP